MNEPSKVAKQMAEQEYGKELRESPLTVTAKRHFCAGYDAATSKLRPELANLLALLGAAEVEIAKLREEALSSREGGGDTL